MVAADFTSTTPDMPSPASPAAVTPHGKSSLPVREAVDVIIRSDMPESSKAASQSVLITTARHLARLEGLALSDGDLLDYDIRPSLSILHAAAGDVAKARGLLRPTEYVSRASRIVELITGVRPTSPRFREECPAEFVPLLKATSDTHASGSFAHLMRLCRQAAHFDAPRTFPEFDVLYSAALSLAQLEAAAENKEVSAVRVRNRLLDAFSYYRSSRQRLIEGANEAERARLETQFAPVGLFRNKKSACHIGVEPQVLQHLRARGIEPALMSPFAILDAVCPALADDFRAWGTETSGARLSPSTKDQTLSALLRVCGAMVRAEHFDKLLELEGIDDLFAISIAIPGTKKMNSRAARRAGTSVDDVPPEIVSLLEAVFEKEATYSLRRSTVTTPEHAGEMDQPYFTDAMYRDADCMWRLVRDLYRVTETTSEVLAQRWGLINARWVRLLGILDERLLPKTRRLNPKDKLLAIRTVTLPQLVCVGIPMRRRAVLALRATWQACRSDAEAAGHQAPDERPQVRAARDEYFDAAVPFMMLCIAVDDGLRRQQYTHGRLGFAAHFRPKLAVDSSGTPIGIAEMLTRWDGDISDPAHLKVTEKGEEPQKREDRDLRPGIVDGDILWDVISIWRPEQLVQARAYESLEDYDLGEDLKSGRFALFPSSRPVPRSHLSRTNVSPTIGRELHSIVRAYLRPELEAWEDRGARWRCIWSAHILRLLNGTYWGGVRDDYKTATWLTMDTEATLKKEYVIVDAHLRDKMGLNKSNWENPNAYDAIMDALCKGRAMFDPLTHPNVAVPPHLEGKLVGAVSSPAKPRIRRARKKAA